MGQFSPLSISSRPAEAGARVLLHAQLVAWVDIAFFCCLLSHVPSACSVVRLAIQKRCVVYSLVTTIPLLSCLHFQREETPLLQYHHEATAPLLQPGACWGRGVKGTVPAALRDPAACGSVPLQSPGKIGVNAERLVAIFYAALNSSTQSLPHQKAVKLLNDLCFPECCPICAGQKCSCPRLVCKSFVSKGFASPATQEETFPWFDLAAAQLRKSPFSQLLEKCELVRCHCALPYQASGDWPTKLGLISTKTSLTSAVMEPGVTLDDKSPFSTDASDIFSEIPEETADYDSKSL
ncbi:LOW QUALITY PROTEIN: NADP-dependent oxidoreductase domain-containing protein 1 [Morus bassanus]